MSRHGILGALLLCLVVAAVASDSEDTEFFSADSEVQDSDVGSPAQEKEDVLAVEQDTAKLVADENKLARDTFKSSGGYPTTGATEASRPKPRIVIPQAEFNPEQVLSQEPSRTPTFRPEVNSGAVAQYLEQCKEAVANNCINDLCPKFCKVFAWPPSHLPQCQTDATKDKQTQCLADCTQYRGCKVVLPLGGATTPVGAGILEEARRLVGTQATSPVSRLRGPDQVDMAVVKAMLSEQWMACVRENVIASNPTLSPMARRGADSEAVRDEWKAFRTFDWRRTVKAKYGSEDEDREDLPDCTNEYNAGVVSGRVGTVADTLGDTKTGELVGKSIAERRRDLEKATTLAPSVAEKRRSWGSDVGSTANAKLVEQEAERRRAEIQKAVGVSSVGDVRAMWGAKKAQRPPSPYSGK